MGGISINYKEVIRKANRLEELAGELEKIADSDLQGVVGMAQSGWTGAASEEYRNKAIKLSDRTKGHARDLRQAAQRIRQSALKYQIIEESMNRLINR